MHISPMNIFTSRLKYLTYSKCYVSSHCTILFREQKQKKKKFVHFSIGIHFLPDVSDPWLIESMNSELRIGSQLAAPDLCQEPPVIWLK